MMHRDDRDWQMPGPPSYFTRRRDGIPVPRLDRFMTGYTNIMKLQISSKTRENSYLVMNRQVWTWEKQFFATRHGEEPAQSTCGLCGQRENTMHLLFECDIYSAPLWSILQECINRVLSMGETPHPGITLHAFNVMYNLHIAGLPNVWGDQIYILIQEVKRHCVYRRYMRCTTRGQIRYDRLRIAAHLLIVLRKIISLREYQGRPRAILEELHIALAEVV